MLLLKPVESDSAIALAGAGVVGGMIWISVGQNLVKKEVQEWAFPTSWVALTNFGINKVMQNSYFFLCLGSLFSTTFLCWIKLDTHSY